MGVSRLLDLTSNFNAVSPAAVNIDISGWDYVVVQLVNPTGTITFNTTLDGGAIQGTTDGNALSAKNWVAAQGTNLNSGASISVLGATGLVRFGVIGKFLQFAGTGITVGGLLVYLFKIS